MNTPAAAMTWGFFARGRWSIPAAALGAIAFPCLILIVLRQTGPIDPRDTSMMIMHLTMVLFNLLMVGAAALESQRPISQLYSYPITTSQIVAGRLLPAMFVVALATAANMAILNLLFGLDWPVWGPALFSAVAFAAVDAVLWLAENSWAWLLLAVTVVSAACGLWFKSRYGPAFSPPDQLWHAVSITDALTLTLATALAYLTAVRAIARNRRGDPPFSLGIIDWLVQKYAFQLSPTPRGSAAQVHFAFEWRLKGWTMPILVVCILLAGFCIWLFVSRDLNELLYGLIGGVGFLGIVACAGGLVFGGLGINDASFAMGSFLATRPISDAELARIQLRAAARSVLIAWGLWVAAVLLVYLLAWSLGTTSQLEFPQGFNWWWFPASLLGLWTIVGGLLSLVLTGSSQLVYRVIVTIISTFVGVMLVGKLALTDEARQVLGSLLISVLGLAVTAAIVWAFVAAKRRSFIETSTVWLALILYSAIAAIFALQRPLGGDLTTPQILLLAGILALAVVPFAAAPLAISWNRHR